MNTPLRHTSARRGTAVGLALAAASVTPVLASAHPAVAGVLPALSSTALVARLAPLVNLRPADLPGWKAHAAPSGVASQATGGSVTALAGCAGTAPLAKLHFASKMSDIFSSASGTQYAGSVVVALGTQADMANVLRAEQGQKLLQCLDKVVVPKLTKTLPGGTKVSVGHLAVPGMGAQSYGYRVRVDLTQGSSHFQVEDDALGYVVGRAEVALTISAVSGSVPIALEARLLRTLTNRLEAHRALAS